MGRGEHRERLLPPAGKRETMGRLLALGAVVGALASVPTRPPVWAEDMGRDAWVLAGAVSGLLVALVLLRILRWLRR